MTSKLWAACTAAVLGLGLGITGSTAALATECPDGTGIQATSTELATSMNECEPDPCPDVEGIQTSTNECEPDPCPEVEGIQSSTNECEPDPCPEVEGIQSSTNECEPEDKKVWVCKFVASENSPGGYALKEGKQPIEVSENALGDDVNDTGTFNDAQPSFVVPSDDATLCSHTTVVVVEHVVCPSTDVAGIVNITTTTTLYYGTTPIGDPVVVHSTRALTAAELAACPDENDKKVWVCKFVASENSPGGYRLKEGKQPIEVSENALGDDVNDTGTFNDAQPSFVVPRDDATLCSHTTEVVVSHVVCPATGVAGIVNITTTTTLFYGTTQIGDPVVVHSTRALTAAELAACPKVIIVVNPQQPTLPVTNGIENASLIVGAGLLLMLAGGSMFWVTRRNSKFE